MAPDELVACDQMSEFDSDPVPGIRGGIAAFGTLAVQLEQSAGRLVQMPAGDPLGNGFPRLGVLVRGDPR